MTNIGKIIRDGWLFGIINEAETCEGWNFDRINMLLDNINKEWDKYGCIVSNLPPKLAKKHIKIYRAAIEKARDAGWNGEQELEDDD